MRSLSAVTPSLWPSFEISLSSRLRHYPFLFVIEYIEWMNHGYYSCSRLLALSRYLDRLHGKPQDYFQNSLFLCFSLCYENTIVCSLGTSVEVPRYICSGTGLTSVRPFFPAVVKSTVRVMASSVLPELGPLNPVHDVIWLWLDSNTASKLYTRILIQRLLHVRGRELPCALFGLRACRNFSTSKISPKFVWPGAFRYRA